MSLAQAHILARNHGLLPRCLMQAMDIMRKQVTAKSHGQQQRHCQKGPAYCYHTPNINVICYCTAIDWMHCPDNLSVLTGHQSGNICKESEGDGPDASLCSKVCPQIHTSDIKP